MDAFYQVLRAEFATPLECASSTGPSQPPPLELEQPRLFFDHSFTTEHPSNNQTDRTLENSSDSTTNMPRVIGFGNMTTPTDSQLSAIFSKMAATPVFDFNNPDLF
jgi:hypothetical protein